MTNVRINIEHQKARIEPGDRYIPVRASEIGLLANVERNTVSIPKKGVWHLLYLDRVASDLYG
jgi:hypothetical protein